MLDIPARLKDDYVRLLIRLGIRSNDHNHYLKWLRFYLDFCAKYDRDDADQGSLTHFLNKLNEKLQTYRQPRQASQAVRLYYRLNNKTPGADVLSQTQHQDHKTARKAPLPITGQKNSWANIHNDLDVAIKVRHYSPKTYKTYAAWVRQFQHFTCEKPPEALTTDDVKSFLTHLAVQGVG